MAEEIWGLEYVFRTHYRFQVSPLHRYERRWVRLAPNAEEAAAYKTYYSPFSQKAYGSHMASELSDVSVRCGDTKESGGDTANVDLN